MPITSKIIVAILVALTLLFSAMYGLLQWSLDRGMLEYVNQRRAAKLSLLVDNLSAYYAHEGSWQAFYPKSRNWRNMIDMSSAGTAYDEQAWALISQQSEPPSRRVKRRPPPQRNAADDMDWFDDELFEPPPRRHERRPPPQSSSADEFNSASFEPPPRRPNSRHKGRGIKGMKLTLLDANKQPVLGRYHDDFQLMPIELSGETVGWLAAPPAKKITEGIDVAFVKQQNQVFLSISLVMLGIVLLVAIPLSWHLVRPLKRLAAATNELKRGNYHVELDTKGRDELARLARDFQDMATSLEQNDSSRKQWLSDVSHELRTPLSIVKGEIEAMMDGIRPFNRDNLQSLEEEIQHLQKLINDLHEFSSAAVGGLRYYKEELNWQALIASNMQRHQVALSAQSCQLQLSLNAPQAEVWGDATRLNQVLDNIISNSLKYTDSQGTLALQLILQGQNVELTIEDSPPGVPDLALPHLFDHLYRVESSRNRQTGGSGLGLALCQKIIAGHNGQVTAYHSSLGGLGIKITLPQI
ncbi:ATP-binding protein [Motilimonas pumila]|uniref:histidine kinase n=1 Tax=Motilimonas pumila TaxID=2303987 RepID=A0A418YIL8_9GAMM|nr:ATP-binding protein [Motilimonas pumila]RJG50459.1 HAMP domain-containing protein [Motilimonas pumila]